MCVFNKSTLELLSHIFSTKGVSPDLKTVQNIKRVESPKGPKEVRSHLGLANYYTLYIPGQASITETLRDLTKNHRTWNWISIHNDALSQDAINSYFDVIVDTSPVGLGAVLVQHDRNGNSKVIAYASRALTDVESRYSQTERDALVVTWGCLTFICTSMDVLSPL